MKVLIEYYRYAGRFLFFRAKDRCLECELTYSILHRLEAELFSGKSIKIVIRPYFTHMLSLLLRRGFKPPLVYINGKIFSRGVVPDSKKLITVVAEILGDDELLSNADHYTNYRKSRIDTNNEKLPMIYFSPACPHCRALKQFLDSNSILYTEKNVVENMEARDELKEISPFQTIPVLVYKGKVLHGFDRDEVIELLDISIKDGEKIKTESVPGPVIDKQALRTTVESARVLLEKNRDGDVTKASSHLYPHQWSWDAAFISRGLLHYDVPAAYRELHSLFRGQWSDGFLPHIVFNNEYLDHFPGPDFWKADKSGKIPSGVFTSGISQPPVHASMLCAAIDLDPDNKRVKDQLKIFYPKIKAFHDFLLTERIDKKRKLVYLVHPWESGLDNAPLWDRALLNVTASSSWSEEMQKKYDLLAEKGKRPSRTYINKYSYLVESLFSRNYNWDRIGKEHEFRICDVLFNSVLCKSESDLGTIAEFIGEDSDLHIKRSRNLKKAINEHLWDDKEGFYYDYDLVAREYIKRDTVFSYIPLYSEICSQEQGQRLVGHLKTHCFCVADRDCMGIPSYDMCKIDYNGEFYWRGPIWFNMSWYVYHGFLNYGFTDDAGWLKKSMMKLVMDNGFFEYYKPESGKGLGADGFSWTAALFLDLVGEM